MRIDELFPEKKDAGPPIVARNQYDAASNSWKDMGPAETLPRYDPMSALYAAAGASQPRLTAPSSASASADMQEQLRLRDQYNAQKQQRDLMLAQSTPTVPQVSRTQGATAEQEAAARAAAFSRAKDQAGAIGRSSLNALRDSMVDRGIAGSGEELLKTAGVMGGVEKNLGDFTNEQLIQDLNSAEHKADLQYSGGITQRGQDLSRANSLLSLIQQSGGFY